jgi:hypothetical protein
LFSFKEYSPYIFSNNSKNDKVNPKQSFPNLEEKILKKWKKENTFKKSISNRDRKDEYVFYDGPPFATGLPHYGHILAGTIKDVVPRFWTMKGKRIERNFGWDCHGLPVENIVENELGLSGKNEILEKVGIEKFNNKCKSSVLRYTKEWKETVERMGRWVDFEDDYKTMNCDFMESIWWVFSKLWKKGLIYRGMKPMHVCPHCVTPLSNFEIAMDNSYKKVTEPSTTYKYKIKEQENTYLLAWSTTPWNKLATPALAVHPTLEYSKVKQGNEFYILATSRLKETLVDKPYEVVKTFTGEELTKLEFELHFDFYPDRKEEEKAGGAYSVSFGSTDYLFRQQDVSIKFADIGADWATTKASLDSAAVLSLKEFSFSGDNGARVNQNIGELVPGNVLALLQSLKVTLKADFIDNLDQTIGGTGATAYTLGTTISEGATDIQSFTPTEKYQTKVVFKVLAKGTGDWTIVVHNAANDLIASETIANADIAVGYNTAILPWTWATGIYHVHIISSVADGTVDTIVNTGSFNGVYGTSVTPGITFNQIQIEYLNTVIYLKNIT